MVDISIVIVNYNTSEHLRKCLHSIYDNVENMKIEIIVVDNNSPQKDILNFPKYFKDVKYLFLDTNKGFGYGCNRGADKANGKYILFLNPDIIVTKHSIQQIFKYAEENPEAACFTGLLMDENNKLSYCFNNFPDLKWEIMEAFGVGAEATVNKMLDSEEIKSNKPFEIDWAHGACMMIRLDVYYEVNGFDENIFLYYEDIDIQRKIKIRGYKIICIPKSRFYHFERSSVRSESSQRIYYFNMHKSKKYYLSKYFSGFERKLIIFIYIIAYMSKIIILPFRNKFKGEKRNKLKHYFIILGVYTNSLKNA